MYKVIIVHSIYFQWGRLLFPPWLPKFGQINKFWVNALSNAENDVLIAAVFIGVFTKNGNEGDGDRYGVIPWYPE